MAMSDGCDSFVQKRCAFNPIKKCNYCKDDSVCDLPAAAAMIMLYYKIKDNIADEKGFKKLGYICLNPIFAGARKQAARTYPEIEKIVSDYVLAQESLEKDGCDDLDRAADPTATALSEIFSLCSEDAMQKRVLSRLGYCMGRYIYLLDAACDLEEDVKKNRYNVLKKDISGDVKQYAIKRVEPQLYFCINESTRAFELLDIKKHKSILGNIIYLGLEETFKKELNK